LAELGRPCGFDDDDATLRGVAHPPAPPDYRLTDEPVDTHKAVTET